MELKIPQLILAKIAQLGCDCKHEKWALQYSTVQNTLQSPSFVCDDCNDNIFVKMKIHESEASLYYSRVCVNKKLKYPCNVCNVLRYHIWRSISTLCRRFNFTELIRLAYCKKSSPKTLAKFLVEVYLVTSVFAFTYSFVLFAEISHQCCEWIVPK